MRDCAFAAELVCSLEGYREPKNKAWKGWKQDFLMMQI
jgi:hypothetical protein